ncbi:hypothetical protein PWG14_20885 (plasmid) [Chromobacterium amazonense]|uniref:hypothetical protein n=1 Tax=Chromobacterium amazonense TaxID=1382803 RepID=UPI00237D91E0|nr:hypothetical protein [Chromobacterium amazonense]MDE1714948.1 hypothetical protein [Chromobacterium amazonense]
MSITDSAIQLLASERLTDFDDGGGMMTGNVVVDGASNNLFDDISELDRTYGRVSLRKCFAAVRTALADTYFGSHVILDAPPADPRVSVTLFTSGSWNDKRANARDFVERYLARGGRWQGYLWERQLAGQRVIQIWQRERVELPAVGSVLCLVNDADKPSEVEQYVRITRVNAVIREFTQEGGSSGQPITYRVRIVTCDISDPLRYDFIGAPVSPFDNVAQASSRAVILQTVVADAAKYYGAAKLVRPAKLGDLRIRVESIFSQLVPSARAETPIVDVNAAGDSIALVKSGQALRFDYGAMLSPTIPLYVGGSILPGTLQITGPGYRLTDAGGQLLSGSAAIGAVDYARGVVSIVPGGSSYAGAKSVQFGPAGSPSRVMDTSSIDITLENRGFSYAMTLPVTPTPGSLLVSYMTQGRWYDLRDDGSGALRGEDASFGAGNINFGTGTVLVTLGALPDVGSVVLLSWATPTNYFNRAGLAVRRPAIEVTLERSPVQPGTLTITWPDGNATRTARDDGNGAITGDASGTIRYSTGEVRIEPAAAPLGGAVLSFQYQFGNPLRATFDSPSVGADGVISLSLPDGGIVPGSLEIEFPLSVPPSSDLGQPADWGAMREKYVGSPGTARGRDNRNGGTAGDVAATIDYAAGKLRIQPTARVQIPVEDWQYRRPDLGGSGSARWTYVGWSYRPVACRISGAITVRYRTDNGATSAQQQVAVSTLSMDLTDQFAERIVSGSVQFICAGKTYRDVGGRLVTDIDPTTGAGTTAGSLDYQTGVATLKTWTPGASTTVTLQSLLTEIGGQPVDEITFRVPVAPMRPGSLSVSATSVSGAQLRVDSDMDSYFGNDKMQGRVDYATGVVHIRFGQLVPAAGNEKQIWYRADLVDADGKIWRPEPVLADTLRYNAVGFTYLPMDSAILGLDAVRLPVDGRVPVFTSDNVLVVHHTGKFPLPNPVSAGVPYNVGRGRLASLRIRDSVGTLMDPALYWADLDVGTVTLKTPLKLDGLIPPLTAEHRIEDMARCYDVQISGDIALTRQLSHDYPAGETLVSSAMLLGDLKARATKLFSQQSWTNRWQDVLDGSPILAQYNEAQYPVECGNFGTIQQRWALIFTSTSEFRIIGETLGQIGVGTINTDCKPINPVSATPYFRLRDVGWGSGWSAGNVLRFNTVPANSPIWLARTVLMGPPTLNDDRFSLQIRGDTDRT